MGNFWTAATPLRTISAASEDPRFPPVRPDELDALSYSVLKPEDERRIVEQRISPLRLSLHVADPEVRRR
ncbi:AMMECR1 domain-containing protein, partial [Eggerthella lenta]|uniref:AMMECR1 domain-containing protein n=1 Tax=Eggerthella lenta TaxID=84112 RepID=UPI00210E7400|nr:AMMECR1 domain-containing protein [Eggerthella lenta]